MMNREERYLVRILFKNKIMSSDGQAFENLFTQIMTERHVDFRAVKPQGQLGDMKNDGYILSTGEFYQVYGPENIAKSIKAAIKKLEDDYEGLFNNWKDDVEIKKFSYVVNDKYKGALVEVHKNLIELSEKLKDLGDYKQITANLIVAKDLEKILFELEEDSVISIVGLIPTTQNIFNVDYDCLNHVIDHILNLPTKDYIDEFYIPDFDEKIKFNGLSKVISNRIETSAINYGDIETYFEYNGDFLRNTIKNKFKELYLESKNEIKSDEQNFADRRYMYILKKSMPENSNLAIQQATDCLMAFYFESCDIFETPLSKIGSIQ